MKTACDINQRNCLSNLNNMCPPVCVNQKIAERSAASSTHCAAEAAASTYTYCVKLVAAPQICCPHFVMFAAAPAGLTIVHFKHASAPALPQLPQRCHGMHGRTHHTPTSNTAPGYASLLGARKDKAGFDVTVPVNKLQHTTRRRFTQPILVLSTVQRN
jgi:hypothetical protein